MDERRLRSLGHQSNKGRESLFLLDPKKLYLVEGTFECFYETSNPNNCRFTLTQCFIKEYDITKRYEELPVVAHCDHLNCIRKTANLQFLKLEKGLRTYWVGKVEQYSSKYNPDIDRLSMKLFVDTRVQHEIETIEKRIRNLNSAWMFISDEERTTRVERTLKLISRMKKVSREFVFVPWVTQAELDARLTLASEVLRQLRFKCSLPASQENPLDELLASISPNYTGNKG